jgi:hypothetical protein
LNENQVRKTAANGRKQKISYQEDTRDAVFGDGKQSDTLDGEAESQNVGDDPVLGHDVHGDERSAAEKIEKIHHVKFGRFCEWQ